MTQEDKYVVNFDSTFVQWNTAGSSPYLNDSDNNYVYKATHHTTTYKEGYFGFDNSGGSGVINSVKIRLEAVRGTGTGDDSGCEVWVYDGSSWYNAGSIGVGYPNYAWEEIDVSSILNTWAKINACKVYLKTTTYVSQVDTFYVRRCVRRVTYQQYTAPTVTTSDATGIDTTVGTLNGSITNTGGENNDQRGFDWGTQSGQYPNSWVENGSFGTGSFSHQITGLDPNKTYYFRAKSHNDAGWGYGSEHSFTTLIAIPSCTTEDATDVTDVTATLNGTLTDRGGENCNQRGFEWGYSSGNYPNSWTENGSFDVGSFTHGVTGLTRNHAVYYRSKVHNSAGWGYGNEKSFQTTISKPTVTTQDATNIGKD